MTSLSNNKTHPVQLNLLPLIVTLELNDIFFIKNYQDIQDSFDIKTWLSSPQYILAQALLIN